MENKNNPKNNHVVTTAPPDVLLKFNELKTMVSVVHDIKNVINHSLINDIKIYKTEITMCHTNILHIVL